MFLTPEDLNVSAYPELVNGKVRYDQAILLAHLSTAQSTIDAHLCGRYLIGPELEKTGDDRHALLVQIGRNLAIYYVYGSSPTIPDKIEKDYDRALKMLAMYAKGELILSGVPAPPTDAVTTANGIAGGSTPPRTSYY